ncbi:MbtH family protein [uncultured Shewanella sp.]|uniref:MbtH family protein n=1 Tax=uncultured Shewanella sp. TaxID=173975 RepID=UPI0026103B9E|nr:MbtH family protein [uncultured Shewanella sp.]
MQSEYLNPFDNTQYQFFVLINDKKQQSLWPNFTDIPPGWQIVYGPDDRENCITFLTDA